MMSSNHANIGQQAKNNKAQREQPPHRSSKAQASCSSRTKPTAAATMQNLQLPSGHQESSSGSTLTMINAPTSLANLAQLSGITLLPIGDYNTKSISNNNINTKRTTAQTNRNLPQNDTSQSPSPNRIGASLQNNKKHNTNHTTSSQYINAAACSNRQISLSKAKPIPDEQQPRVFNISSISSIQSLNQTSNDLIFRRNINVVDSSRSQFNNHTQSMSSANVKREPNERLMPRTQSKIQGFNQTNGVQVIPVSSSLSSLQYLSSSQQPIDNLSDTMYAMSDNIVPGDNYVDVNGDANNISLIKLMAILNNPALTVTAVGPRVQSNNDPFETSDRLASNNSEFRPNLLLSRATSSGPNRGITVSARSRVPQSAANLQIVHESQLQESSGMAQLMSVSNPNSDSRLVQDNEQMHNDYKLDWLSNLNQYSQSDMSTQVQYPSDSCETSYNTTDSTDPTILSTSVRNLMMQQTPQATSKQQSRSAQLLRHIANQEQDNDDSSSINQNNQLSIVEPVYIPGHTRELKQITDDVKVLETDQTVSTSGLTSKKSHGPTKTSRYRLYVPGMENGNLRHSRTNESRYYLNDLTITESQAREVHLSDRHAMLDAMINIEDKKGRRNELTEPDEIFINRSKRVMSKIDTMLERKKRRRFERISGREAPKTNSIEDQCAESEGEWSSDDEAIDLDRISIVKTQLPLEEFESQAKKDHFMSVGLVSRTSKHKIEAELYERRLNLITPSAFQEFDQPDGDMHRFVDTIMKADGEDVQLRVDSNIKRNDLPLLEGLNRNTSRLKMSYMNLIGLEKRSKRTTLYKVKQVENTSAHIGKQTDLRVSKELISEDINPRLVTQRHLITTNSNQVADSAPRMSHIKLVPSNCRDILKLPDKNDYMKSLGLMAS